MPSYKYNPDNTEGAHPTSIDFIDTEIKKDDKIVATDLPDLYDTEITNPEDGQLLAFDETDSLWKNKTVSLSTGDTGSTCEIFYGQDTIESPDAIAVAIGYYSTLVLKADGTLWGIGRDYYGELGNNFVRLYELTQIGTDNDWVSVSMCLYHSVAIKSDGSLWATGYNSYYNLGLGVTGNKGTWTRIGTDNDWAYATAGGFNTIAIKTNGTLWACGRNNYGQCGVGYSTTYITTLTQEGHGATNWRSASSAGRYHTIATRTDGTLWGCGYNNGGQLGTNNVSLSYPFVQEATGSTDWSAEIATGDYSSYAIKTNGELYCCGINNYGQLGFGYSNTSPTILYTREALNKYWKKITANYYWAIGIDTDGHIFGCGQNSYGNLGLGQGSPSSILYFTQEVTNRKWVDLNAGYNATIALLEGSKIIAGAGYNYYFQTTVTSAGTTYVYEFESGGIYIVNKIHIYQQTTVDPALQDGKLYTPFSSLQACYVWLGECKVIPEDTEVLIQLQDTYTISDNELINHPQGYNTVIDFNNQACYMSFDMSTIFDLENDTINYTPVSIGITNCHAIKKIYNAYIYENLQFNSPIVEYTGGTFDSNNDLTMFPSGTLLETSPVESVISGESGSTFIIREDGTLWATGQNTEGQLGLGDYVDRTAFEQVGTDTDWAKVSCYGYTTFAIKSNGTLWCTGNNNAGQLGLGTQDSRNTFIQVGSDTWIDVAAGFDFTIAIKSNGTLWGCGDDGNSQLALGGVGGQITTFTQEILGDTDWEKCYASLDSTYAIKSNGTLWVAGSSANGQLGHGSTATKDTLFQIGTDTWNMISCYSSMAHGIKSDGTLWFTGSETPFDISGIDNGGTNIYYTWTQVGEVSNWIFISDYYLSLGIQSDGTIWGASATYLQEMHDQYTIGSFKTCSAVGLMIDNDGAMWFHGFGLDGIGSDYNDTTEKLFVTGGTAIMNSAVPTGTPFNYPVSEEHTIDLSAFLVDKESQVAWLDSFYYEGSAPYYLIVWKRLSGDYDLVHINPYSLYVKDKSVLTMEYCGLTNVCIDNAYAKPGLFSGETGDIRWKVVNNSTLIVDEEVSTPILDIHDSVYILAGVKQ